MPETGNGHDAATGLNSELIEHIYRTALEPHAYDDFMERWGEYVSGAVRDLERLGAPDHQSGSDDFVTDDIRRHFDMGFRLLEEMGRNSPASYFDAPDHGSKPAFLVDAEGRIVWFNGGAGQLFDLQRQSSLASLSMPPAARAAAQRALASLGAGSDGGQAAVLLRAVSRDGRSILLQAAATRDRSGQNLLVVRESGPSWRREVAEILKSDLGLTPSETEVARLLAEGLNLSEVAARRNSALETIRAHVKSALAKTGARTQADFLRLVMTVMTLAERVAEAGPKNRQKPTGTLDFALGDRVVPVELYGAPQGRPVIFLHGMLDGCSITPRMQQALEDHDLRMIAPIRPGFGAASAANWPIAEAPDRFGAEIATLVDQMQLGRVVLLGHLAGSLYAFAAAAALGPKALGVVNVAGGVPLVNSSQIMSMSPRQRLVACTAKYTPALLPFVLRAGIRQLDFGGQDSFARALYENSPSDLSALDDPEVYDIVCRGYHFTVSQGHGAFQVDAWHVVRDWSPTVRRSTVPVELVHGANDPVVSIGSVRDFAGRHAGRIRLTEANDHGQLVFHARPDMVVDAIERVLGGRG